MSHWFMRNGTNIVAAICSSALRGWVLWSAFNRNIASNRALTIAVASSKYFCNAAREGGDGDSVSAFFSRLKNSVYFRTFIFSSLNSPRLIIPCHINASYSSLILYWKSIPVIICNYATSQRRSTP